jgi:hypothetical protein
MKISATEVQIVLRDLQSSKEVKLSYRSRRVSIDVKALSPVGSWISFFDASLKRSLGVKAPSRCMWCSHFGKDLRNWRKSF